MPTEIYDTLRCNEINRLVALGLEVNTAIAVENGEMDEAFAVAQVAEARSAILWCRGRKNIPTNLTAVWDCAPEHFYLAFDGKYSGDHASSDFVLVDANVDDVLCKLTLGASRDKGPWSRRYKRKSCGIAYRWLHGSGVTPPLLCEFQSQIHIIGGMHRFHLAAHYGTRRMPFLVRQADAGAVVALLPSGTQRLQ